MLVKKQFPRSIQQPKHPHRNPIFLAQFHVVDGQITVGDVGDLAEVFAAAAHFEEIVVVEHEIPAVGLCSGIVFVWQGLHCISPQPTIHRHSVTWAWARRRTPEG